MAESPVPGWVPDDLPAAPGVYRFLNRGDDLLYVGKSVNLRRRVRSYFYGGGPDSDRMTEMLRFARRVQWRRTGSELEARLAEARVILDRQPPYNRALKSSGHAWYLELDPTAPFPRFRVVRSAKRAGARYHGPFRNRSLPETMARLAERVFLLRSCAGRLEPDREGSACIQRGVGLCTAPCVRDVGLDGYRDQVEACLRTLDDPAHAARFRERLVERRERAAGEWDFERAADLQRRVDALDELEGHRWALERPALERSWLLMLPAAREGRRRLLPVARGRVLEARTAPWPGGNGGGIGSGEGTATGGDADRRTRDRWRQAVGDALYAVRVAELRAPAALPARELVPGLIVTRWLEKGAEGGRVVELTDGADRREVAERLAPPSP